MRATNREIRVNDLVMTTIISNSEPVDALSTPVCRSRAEMHGREDGREDVRQDQGPDHSSPFVISSGQTIAREAVQALRQDIATNCYGRDVTHKKKPGRN